MVTSNSLAKRSSFRESSFSLTPTNYQKLQRTVKRKWNKSIFSFQFYKSPFLFYFHFLCHMKMKCWYFDSQFATRGLNRSYCSFFYVKKYFRIKRRRHQKLMTMLINQVLFSVEMRKYARFAEMNMILTMTITKAQLLSFNSWNMRYPSSKFVTKHI